MPRANRYLLPGYVYHVTHRCHNCSFLLKFAVHRTEYCRRLRKAVAQFGISLFGYIVTSNHVHLLAQARALGDLSRFMHKLEGQFSGYYNRRKHRSGAFWQERYRATMVETGEHLLNCLRYIDLNMVRAGVVQHPQEWQWCGYHELIGQRQRYQILDLDRLMPLLGIPDRIALAEVHQKAIALWIQERRLSQEEMWTEGIAVGSEAFVHAVMKKMRRRKRLYKALGAEDAWFLYDQAGSYD